jgi:asparagine synthase (glutamine-hydrolysing)
MCGIAGVGFASPERQADPETVLRMRDCLAHRGPDGAGVVHFPGASLAHRRLSIIDLELGDQPMANEDDSIWVVFNGEIYNYRELHAELSARGHRFRTRSDTEVLVHAYEEWGDGFVTRLNGMFAFALLDRPRRRLLLARDPLGIKPLFYASDAERVLFASEIKGVLAGWHRPVPIAPDALQEYLIFRYLAWDRTLYQGIRRLPPGHLAVWEAGRLSLQRFWAPSRDAQVQAMALDDATAELDTLLGVAVQRQLISDVPLGAFCSGGVDSGLVSCYAAGASPGGFQTFSVGFEDPRFDESPLARDTARRCGTTHREITATAGALEGTLRKLIWHHDEPLSHPNSVPLHELSGLARQHVKVVLTGEGADELFGGYPRYHIARVRGYLEPVPPVLRSGLAALLRLIPGHRASKAAALLPLSLEDSILLNSAYVDPGMVADITGSPVAGALETRRQLVAEMLDPRDPVGSISRYEVLTYLPCALDRMDRMSMAHGLEGRVPFLDMGLTEWALRLPASLKLGQRTNKRVVKRLAARRLSPRIVHGPKSGFGLPLDAWFRGPEFRSVMETLRDQAHPAAGLFDMATVRRLLDEHQLALADHGEVLWLLTNVWLWYESNR